MNEWEIYSKRFNILIECIESFAQCAHVYKLSTEEARANYLVAELCLIQYLFKKNVPFAVHQMKQLTENHIKYALTLPNYIHGKCIELLPDMLWLKNKIVELYKSLYGMLQTKIEIHKLNNHMSML